MPVLHLGVIAFNVPVSILSFVVLWAMYYMVQWIGDLFYSKSYLCGYNTFTINGHLSCFCFWPHVGNVAMSTSRACSGNMSIFPVGYTEVLECQSHWLWYQQVCEVVPHFSETLHKIVLLSAVPEQWVITPQLGNSWHWQVYSTVITFSSWLRVWRNLVVFLWLLMGWPLFSQVYLIFAFSILWSALFLIGCLFFCGWFVNSIIGSE